MAHRRHTYTAFPACLLGLYGEPDQHFRVAERPDLERVFLELTQGKAAIR